ncbi:MAG: methyltransferase domain-containing protein [Desulfobacteraceae bacterium]|nr:methyltransferase domain-containing protein [Desulfobacteraceae bacterium]
MSVFADYARYYNLLYKDKDYAAEADYVDLLIQKFQPGARTILDLGCGTGEHDFILAEKGYNVIGIDHSEEMLTEAKRHVSSLNPSITKSLTFHHGDIRDLHLGRMFDAALALFHVISYQSTNADLRQAFETAATHLKHGGVFIFDCWYGPGVLSDPPTVRVKELEDEAIAITRIAKPVMHLHENFVDVHYHVFIRDKETQQVEEIKELHRMRYLFQPEVEMLLEASGFEPIAFMGFMKEEPPRRGEWNAFFVGRRKG